MRIAPRTLDLSGIVLSSEQEAVRSPGLHVSAIVRYLAKCIGREKRNDLTAEELDRYAMVGRMWEAQLARAYLKPPCYERIGEITLDGIIGSPDSVDTVEWSVNEFKVTWRSSTISIESEWEWIMQVKSYCYMLGMCRATIYPFYVCGTWHPPVPSPLREFVAYDIVFSSGELKDHWKVMRQAAGEIYANKQQAG